MEPPRALSAGTLRQLNRSLEGIWFGGSTSAALRHLQLLHSPLHDLSDVSHPDVDVQSHPAYSSARSPARSPAMRPAVPDTYLPRPRKSPSPGAAEDHPRHSSPETFFLTRDSDLQDSQTAPTSGAETKDVHTTAGGCPIKWPNSLLEKETDGGPTLHIPRKMPATKPIESSDGDHEGLNPSVPSSLPLTPYSPNSPIESSSLQSSPKSMSMRSFRQADGISTHDGGNKRSTGAAETEGGSGSCLLESSEIQDSTPQLIMPSIQMPSRRPFTEKGKSIGKFKILIAGAAGSGKTSLIKSIVQIFEDIVHVDPLPRLPSRPDAGRASSRPGSKRLSRTHHHDRESTSLVEIYASTKPYPSWWSDLEDSRRSIGSAGSGGVYRADLGQQFQKAKTALDSINSDFHAC
ncbi:hypothetical protein PABG_06248 [Paracoccidioides brasiliensis Pb03]|nr:hypothetical protein PABG_06248 [Paracoccidioides brasiliensis Pb03]